MASEANAKISALASVGIDIGKEVFHVVGFGCDGKIAFRWKVKRLAFADAFKKLPPCIVGMEACLSANFVSRTHRTLGHKPRIIPAFYVKARRYNRRFLQMCSHHLIEPVACTPASGWEKGQVENQVGNMRDQLFRPKPRGKSLAELNAWLEDPCIAYAKRTKHPEFRDKTIWEVFQEERASLMERRGPFDGFVEKAVRATTTCLIMADHNRYSVDARAAGRMVLVRSYAERIVVLLGDELVADHPRHFRRDQIIYDPWRYLPLLMKKPGALRNGAPFKNWDLPPALTQVRANLKSHVDGDRQFVKVLAAVLDHGLGAVDAACAEALQAGIASGDVILTVLARQRQPAIPPSITTPDALRLKIEPMADCGRYDSIRKVA